MELQTEEFPGWDRSPVARKHDQSKKGVIKELFSGIGIFLVKKGHIRHYTQ